MSYCWHQLIQPSCVARILTPAPAHNGASLYLIVVEALAAAARYGFVTSRTQSMVYWTTAAGVDAVSALLAFVVAPPPESGGGPAAALRGAAVAVLLAPHLTEPGPDLLSRLSTAPLLTVRPISAPFSKTQVSWKN